MKYIQYDNTPQQVSARRLGVSQSRISNLMRCRVDLFSIDMSLDMLEKIGFKIYNKIEADIAEEYR